MNVRKVHTKIWQDDAFASYSKNGKILFLYLITNPKIGFTGMFECTDRVILFDTGLTKKELEETKTELIESCVFHEGWVFVKKAESYDPIKGENNPLLEAYKKEVQSIPEAIYAFFTAPSLIPDAPSPISEAPLKEPIGTIDGLNGNGKVMEKESKGGLGGNPSLTDNLPETEQLSMAHRNKIKPSEVARYKKSYILWIEEKPGDPNRKGRNMKKTVESWINRDITSGKLKELSNNISYEEETWSTPVQG